MSSGKGPLDIEAVRAQFPALKRRVGSNAAVFFDGPAGSQVPQSVADAVTDSMLHCNANGGGCFATSRESDARIAQAQEKFAAFLGASDPQSVAFGANMTTLTFGLSRALANTWGPGDEIVVTRLDHDANVTPWELAARDAGATVRAVPFRGTDTTLDLDALSDVLSGKTRLVAVGAAANATGTVNPIAEICKRAHSVGAEVFVDAVHYAPHRLPDVDAWGCDYLACSAYKFFGPHVGILWGKGDRYASIPTYQVKPAGDALPWRWMTGTTNAEGVCGSAAALDYLASLSDDASADSTLREPRPLRARLEDSYGRIRAHEEALTVRLLDGLEAIDDVRVWGIRDRRRLSERVATVSITHAKRSSSDVAAFLGERGIFVWAGHFYATSVIADLGVEPNGLVRIGLLHYNTEEEVDRLVAELASL